jgi:hypothetical protein
MKDKAQADLPKKEKAVAKKGDTAKRIIATVSAEKSINVNLVKNFQQQTGCNTAEGAQALLEISTKAAVDGDTPAEGAKAINQLLAMTGELKPRDGFEGILITQMVLVHKQAMHQLSLANMDGNRGRSDLQESLLNRYTKLMRLYNNQLEALDKHRRGGNQKMTVEHVHVHEGGQAIVGNVSQGGGGKHEK